MKKALALVGLTALTLVGVAGPGHAADNPVAAQQQFEICPEIIPEIVPAGATGGTGAVGGPVATGGSGAVGGPVAAGGTGAVRGFNTQTALAGESEEVFGTALLLAGLTLFAGTAGLLFLRREPEEDPTAEPALRGLQQAEI